MHALVSHHNSRDCVRQSQRSKIDMLNIFVSILRIQSHTHHSTTRFSAVISKLLASELRSRISLFQLRANKIAASSVHINVTSSLAKPSPRLPLRWGINMSLGAHSSPKPPSSRNVPLRTFREPFGPSRSFPLHSAAQATHRPFVRPCEPCSSTKPRERKDQHHTTALASYRNRTLLRPGSKLQFGTQVYAGK